MISLFSSPASFCWHRIFIVRGNSPYFWLKDSFFVHACFFRAWKSAMKKHGNFLIISLTWKLTKVSGILSNCIKFVVVVSCNVKSGSTVHILENKQDETEELLSLLKPSFCPNFIFWHSCFAHCPDSWHKTGLEEVSKMSWMLQLKLHVSSRNHVTVHMGY